MTGIVLVMEMTGDARLRMPMIVACLAATWRPAVFGEVSILDSLRGGLYARGTKRTHG